MKLFKQEVKRNGNKYVDLYAAWVYEGKAYAVRVRPVFGNDYEKLIATAQMVPNGEIIEKYI